ncbi:ribosomal protein L25, Ctc-form [Bordetella pertussis H973]|uniref:Large ribosomal subunit protein bL25 n=4 Tax=Bordetella pertussis TaxID=520 RepID=RL25_BORPE|nr:RecName: Full=Large ribosomal subunit protein bL25; AltName: Full=50S ribosomal protein L25; AltName: Full=General stress protein CTC [Bordetella pertussis Tohama I]AEE68309.1 50S ribosomal protein L25/general stress protein Ctc [Bordetella pertussis CS]AIW91209.1 50S ribosomal protein L25 [Bordetella pertussis B1917]AIW96861.1 50S ribosomal protein L25 [Bordetella pertussis B1920]AJB27624.1 50S ribosomal protein L25 [Bordetella pertussis 137]ALH48259.1 50S ribosomal protein L25 [Bordetella
MEFSMKFNATARSVQGSSASRRLRRAGRVPAIVYGGTAAPLNIELDHNEIYHALRKEEFHALILNMVIEGGKTEEVLLRSVQWHAYKPQVMHVDFQRVEANQALHTKVPLHFINAEVSPAVKLSGAIISHVLTELDITCLPALLPQFIEVNLGDLLGGGSIHLADIKLPKGVTFNAHGGDTNPLIAAAVVKGGGAADEGDAAAEQPAA